MLRGDHTKLILIFFILLTTCIWLWQLPVFGTVDDVVMMLMSSGFLGFSTEKILLSHFTIGIIFQKLYHQFDVVNWYPLIYYSLEILAIIHLLIYFLNRKGNKERWLIFIVIYSLFLPLILKIQFTTVAYMCGISGIIILISNSNKNNKYKNFFRTSGWFFFIIASLIRWEVGVSLVLIWGIFFLYQFYKTRKLKTVILPTILLLGLLFIRISDILYYQTPEGNFLIYNEKREILMDFPNEAVNEVILKKYGWTINDFNLLTRWVWIDSKVYSKSKISAIALELNGKRNMKRSFEIIITAITEVGRYFVFLIPVYVVFILFFKVDRTFTILSIMWILIIILGLAAFAKLPFRVFYPILICFPLIQIITKPNMNEKNVNTILFFTSLFVVIISIGLFVQRNRNITFFRKHFVENIEFMRTHPNHTFILLGMGNIPFEYAPMFKNPKTYSAFNLLFTGWHIYTDTYEKFLQQREIKNLMVELVNDSTLIAISAPQDMFKTFMKEHYQSNIEFHRTHHYLDSPNILQECYYIIEEH